MIIKSKNYPKDLLDAQHKYIEYVKRNKIDLIKAQVDWSKEDICHIQHVTRLQDDFHELLFKYSVGCDSCTDHACDWVGIGIGACTDIRLDTGFKFELF